MKLYIREIRPLNWIKNIFIFVPIVFSLELFNKNKLLTTVLAFISFCFISSAVYVFNDICDADNDAVHPIKCTRPIASGAIAKRKAALLAGLFAIIGLSGSSFVSILTFVLAFAYLWLNLFYSLYLKNKAIIDCFCIATGFVLRVYIGGAASKVIVSDWLFLSVAAMSLFMAFGKRLGELIKANNNSMRRVLNLYNIGYLDGMLFVFAGLSITFYAFWSMNRGFGMIYTVPLVFYIVSKYILLMHNNDSQGDPTSVIYRSKSLLVSIALYIAFTISLLYSGIM